ncbi:hypothetical protein BDN70DRAFT_515008 [Pholiota conissans]|uniref:Uncharacterized protein n=1 Tax=Pholiota conissans TaxID=109636 RepID=A0A9P5YNV1_9AGAR|nr:hypothetical protein BDN70DRAFT_515008 [Pholiota conissans]
MATFLTRTLRGSLEFEHINTIKISLICGVDVLRSGRGIQDKNRDVVIYIYVILSSYAVLTYRNGSLVRLFFPRITPIPSDQVLFHDFFTLAKRVVREKMLHAPHTRQD